MKILKLNKKIKNYSALEIARLCGVVNQTAINWIKKDYIKAFTTPGGQYRVTPQELVAFMNGRAIPLPDELLPYELKGTILIIDVDESFGDSLKKSFSYEYPELTVEVVDRGFDAGYILASRKVDLVLINSRFPQISPDEILKREIPSRIIFFSDQPDREEKKRLLAEGADLYIKKPFDLGQISIYLE